MIHLTILSFATNIYWQWQINANTMSIEHWVDCNKRKNVEVFETIGVPHCYH